MFSCERCGSRYSAKAAAGLEHCPRCLGRDGVVARLGFAPYGRPPREGRVAANRDFKPAAVEQAREAARRLDE